MISALPIPADDAEVWGDFDARSDAFEQHCKPPLPALSELIERLTTRFPCISELREDQLENAVWADGPLVDGVMHDVAVLTVVPSRVAAVVPVIREVAKALGLAVYDPQGEQVWRP